MTTDPLESKCRECKRLRMLIDSTQEPLSQEKLRESGYRIRPRDLTDEEAHELWQQFLIGWSITRVLKSIPGLRQLDLRNHWRKLGYPISKYGAYTPPGLRQRLVRDVKKLGEQIETSTACAMAAAYELALSMEPEEVHKYYRRFLRRHGLIHPEWMPSRKPKTTRFP